MKNKYELGALILRLVLGISFLIHGVSKFQGGIENTAGWFASIGLPEFLAYATAGIEVLGGLALILGFFTRYISVLFVVLMAGAIIQVKLAAGFLGDGQTAGYELDLAFLAMSLSLAVTGSKAYALDQLLFRGNEKENNVSVN